MSRIVKENAVNRDTLSLYFQERRKVTPKLASLDLSVLNDRMDKILRFAHTIECYQDETLVGLLACYLNDASRENAFITHVSVLPAFQKKGIASTMMERLLETVKARQFRNIILVVSKNNTIAVQYYKKFGFQIMAQTDAEYKLIKKMES